MNEFLDYFIFEPAQLVHVDSRKPLLNKGASKPKPPPAPVAPFQSNVETGTEEALIASKNRKGLRSTILAQDKNQSLAPVTGGVTKLGQTSATTLGTLAK